MTEPLRIFLGWDDRQAIAYNVLQHSIIRHTSCRVQIEPLKIDCLPIKQRGMTPFTYTRFLVPYLCGFKGQAIFMDADMLVLGDVAALGKKLPEEYAAAVVKCVPDFERASMVVWNCAHPALAWMTPDGITEAIAEKMPIHGLQFLKARQIATLAKEWNVCVGYSDPIEDAKIVHFTQGMPLFEETQHSDYKDIWDRYHQDMNSTWPWKKLMGGSCHSKRLGNGNLVAKLYKENGHGEEKHAE